MGDKYEAIESLKKAIDLGDEFKKKAISDPDLNPIRSDPRFQKLIK